MTLRPERVVVSLDERELLEMEAILHDQDREEALQFLRRLRKRILEMQRRGPLPFRPPEVDSPTEDR